MIKLYCDGCGDEIKKLNRVNIGCEFDHRYKHDYEDEDPLITLFDKCLVKKEEFYKWQENEYREMESDFNARAITKRNEVFRYLTPTHPRLKQCLNKLSVSVIHT